DWASTSACPRRATEGRCLMSMPQARAACPYGTHRVIEPPGVLPQPAWRLDNDTSAIFDNEVLIDVQALNVDAASFTQMKEAAHGDADGVAELILPTWAQRRKLLNPATASGGMLIGRVASIGPALAGRLGLAVGDRIATFVSLPLTPLRIDHIPAVHLDQDRVDLSGQAV